MVESWVAMVTESTRRLVDQNRAGVGWKPLREMGWFELHAEDAHVATSTLMDTVGRAAVPSCAVDATVEGELREHGFDVPHLSVVVGTQSAPAGGLVVGTLLPVEGLVLWHEPGQPTTHVVSLGSDDDPLWTLVEASSDAWWEPVRGVDPSSRGHRVMDPAGRVVAVLDRATSRRLETVARRAVAYELVGLAGAMLDVSVGHVTTRTQFGRPIGGFQAVKHRLADVHVAIEAAEAALDASWTDDRADLAVRVAKALAGRAAGQAVRHGLQVTGGMGFTDEFPLGRLVRRSLMLEPVLGRSSVHTRSIGRSFISARSVNRLTSFDPSRDEFAPDHDPSPGGP